MSIDKSWTSLPNRLSSEYLTGVREFIVRARNSANASGNIRCPCRDCGNAYWWSFRKVHDHLIDKGMSEIYKREVWTLHGENSNTSPTVDEIGSNNIVDDDCYDMLHDLVGPSHVQLEDSNDGDHRDGCNDGVFDKLFDDLKCPLFPGCEKFFALAFLVKLMHIKVMSKWSNKSFDMLLKLLNEAFPNGTKLPGSYYETKTYLRALGLGYESIHACKYDCILYWKENAKLEQCPICSTSRWKDKDTTGKKIPHKVLRYFPLEPRLRRWYRSGQTAKDMRWHDVGREKTEGVLRHPADGLAWKNFDRLYPDFAKEPRNVRLGLASDGFNPFGNMSNAYSMWPVIVVPYNMPMWKCMKESSFMMTLLIPGPSAPGKDIDVYLRPLVDELKDMWDKGVQVYDCEEGADFHFTLTPQIKQAMDGQMASQLRNWRCDMHNHFRDVGGEVNPQIAKTIPHKDIINIDDWIWLCDYWSNETQIDVATRNKDNRKKRDAYLSSHGSKSFSAHRADLVNPETSQFVGDIEFHRLMYTSHKTNTWCDPQAEADYVDMLKIRESQSQHSSDVSSSESHNVNISEEEIVRRVRKPRPGYVKGKGRVIKGSSSCSDGSSAAQAKEMNDMKIKLSTYETQLTYTMSFIKQMTEKWNIQFPGTCPTFDANIFAPPPQDDAGTSASQPNPPNTSQQGDNNNNFDDCYHPSPPRDPFI